MINLRNYGTQDQLDQLIAKFNEYALSNQVLQTNDFSQVNKVMIDNITIDFSAGNKVVKTAVDNKVDITAFHIFWIADIPDDVIKDVNNGEIPYKDWERFWQFYTRVTIGHYGDYVDEWSMTNEISARALGWDGNTDNQHLINLMLEKGTIEKFYIWGAMANSHVIMIFNEGINALGRTDDPTTTQLIQKYTIVLNDILQTPGVSVDRVKAGIQAHSSIFYFPTTTQNIISGGTQIQKETGVKLIGITEATASSAWDDPYFTYWRDKGILIKPDVNYQVARANLYDGQISGMAAVGGSWMGFGLTDYVSMFNDFNLPDNEKSNLPVDNLFHPKYEYYEMAKTLFLLQR